MNSLSRIHLIHLIFDSWWLAFLGKDAFVYFTFWDGFYYFNYLKENWRLAPSHYKSTTDNNLVSSVYIQGSFVLKMVYDIFVGRDSFFAWYSHYLNSFRNNNVDISAFIYYVILALKNDFFNLFL